MKSMGKFQLIGVEGERRKQVPDMRLGKGLKVYYLILPRNGQTAKKKVPARHFWCETVDYIP
jgi:hypothetical protein